MGANPIQFKIDQVTRVLTSMGWIVLVTDTSGPTIRITIEAQKPGGAPGGR